MLLLIWHLGSSGLGISHGGLLFFTFIYLLLWWYDMTLNNEMRIHTADPTYLDWGVVVVLLFGIKLHVPQLRSPVAAPLKLPLPSPASSITISTCDLVQVILRTLNCGCWLLYHSCFLSEMGSWPLNYTCECLVEPDWTYT